MTALAQRYFSDAMPAAPATTVTKVNVVVRAAWYLFVMSIPFELPKASIPIEVPTMTGALFLLATILHTGACYRRFSPALFWFILYLWAMGISALVNNIEHGSDALELGVWLIQLYMIFWAATNLLRRDEMYRGTLMALAVACAARSAVQLLGIAATVTPVWGGGERITAFGQNSNLAAMILSTGLVAALGLRQLAGRGSFWRAAFSWALAGVIGAAILQTGSRGGVVCAIAGVVALLLAGRIRISTILLGIVTVAALGVGVGRSETLRKRFLSAEEGNLAGRERIYPAAIEMIKERPLTGWGPADNQFELGRRVGVVNAKRQSRDMHNLVLELWTVAGIGGALLFLIGFGICAGGAWAARAGPRAAVPLALLAAIVPGTLAGTWIASKILWLVLAIIAASGQAGQRYVAVIPEES